MCSVPLQPGALEVEMGRMLPMLQQVGNFAERCNALVLNLVQQVRAQRADLHRAAVAAEPACA